MGQMCELIIFEQLQGLQENTIIIWGGGGYPTAFHKLIKPDISKMKLVEKE